MANNREVSRQMYGNRARLLEEASEGLHKLMHDCKVTKSELAKLLGVTPPAVTKLLEGSNNFKLETLADAYFVLGRSVHFVLGTDLDEMRLPVDEANCTKVQTNLVLSCTGIAHAGQFKDVSYLSKETRSRTTDSISIDSFRETLGQPYLMTTTVKKQAV